MIEAPDRLVVTSTKVSEKAGKSRELAALMTDEVFDCVRGTRPGFPPGKCKRTSWVRGSILKT